MNIVNPETGEVSSVELQSAEINELAKALSKAQGVMTSAQKDGSNPHFRSSYATLSSIIQAARKPLADNCLSVVQSLLPDNTLVTTLMHESGQWMRSYLKLNPAQNTPQGVGSALTYGRRYSLAAIVGISQDDDDGVEANAPGEKKPAAKRPEQPSPAAQPVTQSKPTNGKAEIDPMTRFWSEVKAAGLERSKGLEILAGANNDPSRAVDVLLGMAQAA
jgi:hypothetical protein